MEKELSIAEFISLQWEYFVQENSLATSDGLPITRIVGKLEDIECQFHRATLLALRHAYPRKRKQVKMPRNSLNGRNWRI